MTIEDKWRSLLPKGGESLQDFISRERARGIGPDLLYLQEEIQKRTPPVWTRIPTVPVADGTLAYSTDDYRFVAEDRVSIVEVWLWEGEDRPRFVLQYGHRYDESPIREFYDDQRRALEAAIQKMTRLYGR